MCSYLISFSKFDKHAQSTLPLDDVSHTVLSSPTPNGNAETETQRRLFTYASSLV